MVNIKRWYKKPGDKKAKTPLSKNLSKNVANIHAQLNHTQDLTVRYFRVTGKLEACLIHLEGMIDTDLVQRDVLDRLQQAREASREQWMERVIGVVEARTGHTMEETTQAVLDGQVVLLSEGSSEAIFLTLRSRVERQVAEPITERTLYGARDGFVENLQHNLAMLRRRLRDPQLVVESYVLGKRSRTRTVLIYIRDIADPLVIAEARRRLTSIDTDSISATGYIEEMIEDSHYCFFPQMLGTERPDRVAAQLLEGRFAILADGTPFALAGPVVFSQFFQATEDYYERWMVGSVVRLFRFFAFIIATSLTASYIALVSFHIEMIPFGMLAFIAESRRLVPLPPFAEALLVEIIIEFLREAGLRIPQPIGQTMGVVGGIVLGDALLRANLVSPLMIVVAVAGVIASFAVPSYTAALNLRLIKFPIIFMATIFGGVGIVGAWIIIITNMARTSSFGVPLLSPFSHPGELKDLLIRLPMEYQSKRPDSIPHQDDTRLNPSGWRKKSR